MCRGRRAKSSSRIDWCRNQSRLAGDTAHEYTRTCYKKTIDSRTSEKFQTIQFGIDTTMSKYNLFYT